TSGLVRAGGTWVMARFRRSPVPAAEEPVRQARPLRVPIRLVHPVEGAAGKPGPAGKREAPPPINPEPERKAEPVRKTRRLEMQEELFAEDTYRLPPVSLLDPPQKGAQPIDEAALLTSSRILENKLADFGVAGKVVAVRPGPVITTFEFEPAPGVKVSRIVNLADDLTMALRAASVRILAPIPGKPVVGVEVS